MLFKVLRFMISFDFVFIVVGIVGLWNAYHSRKKKGAYLDESSVDELYGGLAPLARGKSLKLRKKTKPRTRGGLRVNKNEERCREIFEKLYRREFPTIRPDFLKNPATNRNLELDGYCPTIKTPIGMGLAFEYDGIQHSQHSPYFHGNNPYKFVYQVEKDKFKDKVCKEKGILLIRIPHFVAYNDLERFIRHKLKQNKL